MFEQTVTSMKISGEGGKVGTRDERMRVSMRNGKEMQHQSRHGDNTINSPACIRSLSIKRTLQHQTMIGLWPDTEVRDVNKTISQNMFNVFMYIVQQRL